MRSGLKLMLCIGGLLLPSCVLAADETISSKLTNQSKQQDTGGYYLEQVKVYAENDCVKDSGSKKINPGESTVLTVKKGCIWGGVRYKIINVDTKKEMGSLSHNYRDGAFSIEVSAPCTGTDCNFYDLSPVQDRKDMDKKQANNPKP